MNNVIPLLRSSSPHNNGLCIRALMRRTALALHGQLANLGMQFLHPLLGVDGKTLTAGEQLRGALKQLLLPRRDLGGMDLVLLGELGERLIATDGLQSDLRLERGRVIATRPFHVDCSFSWTRIEQFIHLS